MIGKVFLILTLLFGVCGAEFEPPTKQHIAITTLETIKYNLKGKGTGLEYRELFDKAIAEEKIGFLGYYGDSLDFLIYQDIIRVTVEEVLGIAVRKDFHFISVPIESSHPLYVLEDLSPLFKREVFPTLTVMENTFPLNFSLYSNHNQLGLNSVVNFSKNTGESSWRNRRELQQFFLRLGMNPTQIETFYDLGHQLLDTSSGVLLQFFDASPSPYAFANAVGYASYPNGFIAENRLISEYFVDNPTPRFHKSCV